MFRVTVSLNTHNHQQLHNATSFFSQQRMNNLLISWLSDIDIYGDWSDWS